MLFCEMLSLSVILYFDVIIIVWPHVFAVVDIALIINIMLMGDQNPLVGIRVVKYRRNSRYGHQCF